MSASSAPDNQATYERSEGTMFREPCRIGNVAFTNRVLRSSMGGRNCFYDGTVSPAFTPTADWCAYSVVIRSPPILPWSMTVMFP